MPLFDAITLNIMAAICAIPMFIFIRDCINGSECRDIERFQENCERHVELKIAMEEVEKFLGNGEWEEEEGRNVGNKVSL